MIPLDLLHQAGVFGECETAIDLYRWEAYLDDYVKAKEVDLKPRASSGLLFRQEDSNFQEVLRRL